MLATFLFALVILLITPATRERIGSSLQAYLEWTVRYQPFSFLVVVVILGLPLVVVGIMKRIPQREVPGNPMARYKDDVVED